MIFDGALGGSDMRFIAPIHCPPLDPLGPDQSSGNQYPHVFAEGGGTHTEFIGDQHAAHPVLDQVAIYLRREMRARVAQPLQYLKSSLVCQCAQNVHENHFATLPIDEFMSSCFAMDDSITDQEVTITRERIAAAARVIRPYVRHTPIIEVDAAEFGLAPCRLIFKLEQLQHSGSFKARGAFANLLLREVPKAGVVAASGGNHGVAVAYAARRLGVPATIFVPGITSPAKLERIRSYRAELIVGGALYADALAASEVHVTATGAMPIHAFDQLETLLGQGTIGLELEADAPDLDSVLVAVGGGGLIGGIAAWYAARVKVVGVEPESAPTLRAAFAAGEPVDAPAGGIAADSLAPKRVGQLMFPIARSHVAPEVVLVTDDDIRAAQAALWSVLRLVAEPGSAAAFAGLLSGRYRPSAGERVTVLVCGANTTAVRFDE